MSDQSPPCRGQEAQLPMTQGCSRLQAKRSKHQKRCPALRSFACCKICRYFAKARHKMTKSSKFWALAENRKFWFDVSHPVDHHFPSCSLLPVKSPPTSAGKAVASATPPCAQDEDTRSTASPPGDPKKSCYDSLRLTKATKDCQTSCENGSKRDPILTTKRSRDVKSMRSI